MFSVRRHNTLLSCLTLTFSASQLQLPLVFYSSNLLLSLTSEVFYVREGQGWIHNKNTVTPTLHIQHASTHLDLHVKRFKSQ